MTEEQEEEKKKKLKTWHRYMGLSLTDTFYYDPYNVTMEVDISVKRQILDVLIIERGTGRRRPKNPPAGFDQLAPTNLITFKSHHEALNPWAMDELVCYYCGYRKMMQLPKKRLPPARSFQLYAVCTRYPGSLLKGKRPFSPGVYDIVWGSQTVRVIVLSRIPKAPENAIWNLFSRNSETIKYGMKHYEWKDRNISTIINALYATNQEEGVKMSYTVEDFKSEQRAEFLEGATLDERLDGLTPEQRMNDLTPKQIANALTPEQIANALTPGQIANALTPEQRMNGLTPEQIRVILQKMEDGE